MSLSIFSSAFISSYNQMASAIASATRTFRIGSNDATGVTRASGSNGNYDIQNLMAGLGQMMTRCGVASHVTKLFVYCSNSTGATIELYKNGAGTGLTATVTGPGHFEATGSVAVAKDDALGVHIIASGGGNTVMTGVGIIIEAD